MKMPADINYRELHFEKRSNRSASDSRLMTCAVIHPKQQQQPAIDLHCQLILISHRKSPPTIQAISKSCASDAFIGHTIVIIYIFIYLIARAHMP